MSDQFQLLVADVPDREHLVVEVWRDDVQVAEASRTADGHVIEIYQPVVGAGSLILDLPAFKIALEQAEEQLRRHERESGGE